MEANLANIIEPTPRLLNTAEAARVLGVAEQTLRLWRIRGGGPRFVRVSKSRTFYNPLDLHRWIEERTFESTSQETVARKSEIPRTAIAGSHGA